MTDDRTCRLTPQMMADHLGSPPGGTASRKAARHIESCPDCRAELAALEPVSAHLRQWREQPVPDWNRHGRTRSDVLRKLVLRWQWAPLAASMVLALAVVFNVQVSGGDDGWSVVFGTPPARPDAVPDPAPLAELEAGWQQELARTERRLTDETARQIESVLEWVDSRREADLRMLEASFQEMLEREYQTARSVQQLVSYVQYGEQ